MRNGNKPLELPCNVGQDESGGGRMGALYAVENMELPSLGDTLRRRRGYTTLNGSGPTYSFHLFPSNKTGVKPSAMLSTETCNMIGNSRGYAFGAEIDATSATQNFFYLGNFSTVQPVGTLASVASGQNQIFGANPPSVAINSDGYVCLTCPTSGSYTIVSLYSPSGHKISCAARDATEAKVIALGTVFYLVTQKGTTLAIQKCDTDSGISWTAVSSFTALVDAGAYWDICGDGSSKWWLVRQSAATGGWVRYYSGDTWVEPAYELTFTSGGYCPLSISWLEDVPSSGTNTVWVGWYDDPGTTGDVKYTVLNEDVTDATSGGGPYTIISSTINVYGAPMFGRVDYSGHDDWDSGSYPMTTAAFWICRYSEDGPSDTVRGASYGIAHATDGPSSHVMLHPGLMPVGKPDNMNRVWCITDNGSGYDSFCRWVLAKFFVRNYDTGGDGTLNFSKAIVVEAASPLQPVQKTYFNPGTHTNYNWFCSVSSEAWSGSVLFPVVELLMSSSQAITTRVKVLEYTLSENKFRHSAKQFRESAIFSGVPTEVGVSPLAIYETTSVYSTPGAGSSEIGWAFNPIITNTSAAYGGGSIAAGTYLYKVVYQWADGKGRRHLSAPSASTSVTASSGSATITLTITSACASLRLTNLSTVLAALDVSVLLYRTTDGGTTYHLVTSVAGVDHSDGLVTIADTYPDASISDEEILYTDGGVLPNHLAPSGTWIAVGADRIWVGGCFDSYTIYCSKILVPEEPPNFTEHAAFQVTFPEKVTGLCIMDDTVLVFSKRSIFAVSGQGPNDQGNGYFDPPRRVSDGIGCINGHSIVVTEIGVLFQSKFGFKLLPRGLGAIEDIGQPVNVTVSSNDYVDGVGAVNETDETHQAKFLVSTSGGTSQNILTFDLVNRQWTRDVFGAGTLWSCLGAWSLGFALAGVDDEGSEILGYQTGLTYTDCGEALTAKIQTSWQHPFGTGCWGRVNRILLPLTGYNYTLTCTVEVDGASESFSVSVPSATPATSPYVYREVAPARQQGSAWRVTLSSASTPTSDSRLFGCGSILFEIDDSDGTRLMTAAERGA